MCHPGEIDDELRRADSVIETRPRELEFFAGDEFSSLCAKFRLRLARMSDMLAASKV